MMHSQSRGARAAARVEATLGAPLPEALVRSLAIYYGDSQRDAEMDQLYASFLKVNALAFDIGSHVGDRIASFRRLGARVVALEPQPVCAAAIHALYSDDAAVTLLQAACGATEGNLVLHVNSDNPTVSTASPDFLKAAVGAPGWENQVWDTMLTVPVTTLDILMARHGQPDFIKIDVEGFEDQVLAGLSKPVPVLSFEFTTIQRDVAERCLAHLSVLGYQRFNLALGESQTMQFAAWLSSDKILQHILHLPHSANSGDIYASLL